MRLVAQAFGKLRQFLPCIVAAAIGVTATATAFSVMMVRDDNDAKVQFNVLAENHFMVLQNGVNEYVNRLKAVRALFDSSIDPVSRSEFDAFTQPLLREDAVITTLSWVPRVSDAERAVYERKAVLQGLADYHIKSMGADGKMIVALQRNVYYPIFYATVPKISQLYGLDLASEPTTFAELERARDLDRMGFSPVATLVSSGGTQGGFLFSLPTYRRGPPHDSIEDRRRNLIGFVHGSLTTARMVDTIINDNKTPKGLDLFFFLPGSDSQAMPVYVHPSRLRGPPLAPMSQAEAETGRSWRRDLNADGQPLLTMVARPMPDGPLNARHGRTWVVGSFGLILTGAL